MVVSDTSIFILITLGMGLFVYANLGRLLGSVIVMIVGLGMMYVDATNAWAGLIVLLIGLLMALNIAFESPMRMQKGYRGNKFRKR